MDSNPISRMSRASSSQFNAKMERAQQRSKNRSLPASSRCIDTGSCLRRELGITPGERYELCRSVHAEQNAIINAARAGIAIVDGELYIHSERIEGQYSRERGETSKIYGPCIICAKMIINAGLAAVHMREEGVGTRTYTPEDIKRVLLEEEQSLRAAAGDGRS